MATTNEDNLLLVSGPQNALRLEGNRDGTHKILYVFFTPHVSLTDQTNCGQDKDYDIVNYLMDNFKTNDKISFFLETFLQYYSTPDEHYYYQDYLTKLRKFFSKYFMYNPDTAKVVPSKKYPNVLFHYLDFRIDYNYTKKLAELVSLTEFNPGNLNQLEQIHDSLLASYYILQDDYDYMYKFNAPKPKPFKKPESLGEVDAASIETVKEFMYQYMHKIRHSYKYADVSTKINKIIDTEIKELYDKVFVKYNKLLSYLSDMIKKRDSHRQRKEFVLHERGEIYYSGFTKNDLRNLSFQVQEKIDELDADTSTIYVLFVDCYFLRRFLDKEYTEKNVVFVGSFHAVNYVRYLISLFDFKITHYSYLKYDLNTSNKKLLNESYYGEAHEIIIPPNMFQCSDLTSFPTKFD